MLALNDERELDWLLTLEKERPFGIEPYIEEIKNADNEMYNALLARKKALRHIELRRTLNQFIDPMITTTNVLVEVFNFTSREQIPNQTTYLEPEKLYEATRRTIQSNVYTSVWGEAKSISSVSELLTDFNKKILALPIPSKFKTELQRTVYKRPELEMTVREEYSDYAIFKYSNDFNFNEYSHIQLKQELSDANSEYSHESDQTRHTDEPNTEDSSRSDSDRPDDDPDANGSNNDGNKKPDDADPKDDSGHSHGSDSNDNGNQNSPGADGSQNQNTNQEHDNIQGNGGGLEDQEESPNGDAVGGASG